MAVIKIPRTIQNNSPLKKAHSIQITNLLYIYSVILTLKPGCTQKKEVLKPGIMLYRIFKK